MIDVVIAVVGWVAGILLGLLVLAFIIGVIGAVVRRNDKPAKPAESEPDPHDAEALAIGRYILANGLDQGEVWVRVRRCSKHGGQHLDIGLLPTLKEQ